MNTWTYAVWFGVLIAVFYAATAGVAVWGANTLATNVAVFVLFILGCIFLLALIVTVIVAWTQGATR